MVDSNDLANELPVTVNSAEVPLVALWLKIAPPREVSEVIGKWFAGIYTVGKKVLLYVGQVTRRFLLDSDSKTAHTELNCSKLHQPGSSAYIESIPHHLHRDITVFIYTIHQQW